MSALWRINLLVGVFFGLLAAVCLVVLLHQGNDDVRREMDAARGVLDYLREAAQRDPASLDPDLTSGLRHVRVHWLDTAAPAPHSGLDDWLVTRLYPDLPAPTLLTLADGRRVQLSLDPRDEIDEVRDSLVQLLVLFGVALLASLLAIRWAVRGGLRVVEQLHGALGNVSRGQFQVRLPDHSLPEAQRLASGFNGMAAALEHACVENAELTRALLAVQERERLQLAQALHDDIGQYLAGIRAQVFLLRSLERQDGIGVVTLDRLEQHCQGLNESFRALVRDLYPVVLERVSLEEALRLHIEQWQASQGVACRLRLDELPALPAIAKAHLYRLLQEALTNVARHAGARHVRVVLRRREGRLFLWVRDDGRGCQGLPRAGIGMRSMRERARCLGGELHLRRRPGGGLALRLWMPLTESVMEGERM
ncbi:histidine kinase [Pseudomonas nicosulfuronedens]|uniref:histidine kinase n=1 Tax=Pseudomonas nicosulfuronedens TaxID=2571105 RepID=A0A5R9R0L6_9PSED|nr:ATP-binding protein [Pseudomonas nicosulfuronedens]MDH1011765.1 histidine kinase [Pseudomonas nicosulfuronedens]MDH1980742.1 histidine kinase [Pseudomonas nicosulfuronedens]MDH2027859.1 histidine kinase [Pseudomonas nicosulfuronedens]TLX75921.1 HAMP domain-containing protein [Pseudomonas nicosulfuronedens]